MSANVTADGTVKQLDKRPEPDENVTEQAVQQPKQLARFLLRLFRELALIRRRWVPRRIDFAKVTTGSDSAPETFLLNHGLNGPVVWWVVKVTAPGTQVSSLLNAYVPLLVETSASTENLLFLQSYYSATLTIRVEEAG